MVRKVNKANCTDQVRDISKPSIGVPTYSERTAAGSPDGSCRSSGIRIPFKRELSIAKLRYPTSDNVSPCRRFPARIGRLKTRIKGGKGRLKRRKEKDRGSSVEDVRSTRCGAEARFVLLFNLSAKV